MAADTVTSGPNWAVRTLPLRANEPCGDAGVCFDLGGGATQGRLLAIIDGLGHGAEAAIAAEAAVACIADLAASLVPPTLSGLLAQLDDALRTTRGAAVGVVALEGALLRYAGVGNTRALRWRGEQVLRLSSQYGIVGGGIAHPVLVTELDLLPGDWLMLYTDGIAEMLKLDAQLPEWEREPALLCEYVLTRWREGRDDAGVLAWHHVVAPAPPSNEIA